MAVTSIWRVHGSVGKVLDYVENAEKTTAVSTGDGDLSDVIDYAIQQRKTSQTQVRDGEEVVQRFVSGINCNPRTAKMEMQKIKKFYGKEDGVIAYHGYQSFAPGEATPELAHEIGVKLAQRLWGDRYQVLVATHLDRANHLHSHFVINTVSFVDGIKYHRTKQDYKEMQRASDALCKEYGLSVIRNPKGRGKTYSEWAAEKDGKPTLRGIIRSDIDHPAEFSGSHAGYGLHLQNPHPGWAAPQISGAETTRSKRLLPLPPAGAGVFSGRNSGSCLRQRETADSFPGG